MSVVCSIRFEIHICYCKYIDTTYKFSLHFIKYPLYQKMLLIKIVDLNKISILCNVHSYCLIWALSRYVCEQMSSKDWFYWCGLKVGYLFILPLQSPYFSFFLSLPPPIAVHHPAVWSTFSQFSSLKSAPIQTNELNHSHLFYFKTRLYKGFGI